jgi:hypothetical protein
MPSSNVGVFVVFSVIQILRHLGRGVSDAQVDLKVPEFFRIVHGLPFFGLASDTLSANTRAKGHCVNANNDVMYN